jgi:hypothetical protein
MTFVTNLFVYGEGLLAPRPTPKLEDHPLSFVRGCLFNVFAAILHSWRPFHEAQKHIENEIIKGGHANTPK